MFSVIMSKKHKKYNWLHKRSREVVGEIPPVKVFEKRRKKTRGKERQVSKINLNQFDISDY